MDQHDCVIRINKILEYDATSDEKITYIKKALRELKDDTDCKIKATGYKYTVYRNKPFSNVKNWEHYKTESGAKKAYEKNLKNGLESKIVPYIG